MIKNILDEIANEPGSNAKMDILRKYKDNAQLARVMYLAKSKRVKFYIKQIPEYESDYVSLSLTDALNELSVLSKREKTGHDAVEHLQSILTHVSAEDAYVIERIIDKDLKIGMGTSNINKVFKDLIEKTPYMGAKAYSEKLVNKLFEKDDALFSQIKMDGRYCNAIVRSGEVELESRAGETTHVGEALFLDELARMDDGVFNGELTIDGLDRYTANGIIASIVDIEGKREERGIDETQTKIDNFEKKHGPYDQALFNIRYTCWDRIKVDEYFDKISKNPYNYRFGALKDQIKIHNSTQVSVVEYRLVNSFAEATNHFQEALNEGLEGTVLKTWGGIWKDGKPNHQVKMKLEINLDLRVKGFQYGKVGTKNENVIATIELETEDGILKTNAAGMDEDMMDYVTENQDQLLNTVVEIRCCGLSQDSKGAWSTLHPSVVKLRDDKDTCDSLKSAQLIEAAAKGLKE